MTTTLLRKLSITYIVLPNLLFSFGWFRQPYSFLLITGYLFLLFREFQKNDKSESFNFKEILFLILFALILTFFSGAGGFSQQKSDFFSHNAKFYDLYKNPWPIYFPEINRYACYYFGYYLVPAFIASITGHLYPLIIYFWTAIGFFLGFSWIYLLIDRSKFGIFAFLWFRGLGYILYLSFNKTNLVTIPLYRPVINGIVQQSSYVPNQFIGTLIVTCILIHDAFIRKKINDICFPITLIFIWGIFPSVTLVLIYVVLWARHYILNKNYKEIWVWSSITYFILPVVLLLPTLGYFLSANNTTVRGFLWQFDKPINAIFYYTIGIFFDLLLYYWLVRSLRSRDKLIPFWFVQSLFVLLIMFSFYRIGFHNDWFYRTQIPIFIVIIIVLLRSANSYIKEKSFPLHWLDRTLAILVVLMMGLQMTAYVHLLKDNVIVKSIFPSKITFKPMPYDRFPNVYQLMKKVYGNRGDAEQYLGDKRSFYELYLAKSREERIIKQ